MSYWKFENEAYHKKIKGIQFHINEFGLEEYKEILKKDFLDEFANRYHLSKDADDAVLMYFGLWYDNPPMTHKQIAEKLEITPGMSNMYVYRFIRELKESETYNMKHTLSELKILNPRLRKTGDIFWELRQLENKR